MSEKNKNEHAFSPMLICSCVNIFYTIQIKEAKAMQQSDLT